MNVLIITGGSNGIGKAVAEKYTLENYSVFSISRSKATNVSFHQITADLSDTTEAINVYWMVWMVKEVAQQLRKELKHKPSVEEVANEMGWEPSKLRYLYN